MTVISSTDDVLDDGRTDIPDASISVETRAQTTLLRVTREVDASVRSIAPLTRVDPAKLRC